MAAPLTVAQCIQKAYQRATGKTDTLTQPDVKYLRLYELADDLQQDWASESGVDWMTLYDVFDFGKVQTTTQPAPPNKAEYPGDDTMRKISQREGDSVVVMANDGSKNYWKYDIITPDKALQYIYNPACYFQQGDLFFTQPFLANDKQVGAEILVPGFHFCDNITDITGAQIIQVNDPNWLIYMMAAEFVRTDLVRQNQYGNLIALANDRMQAMMQDNEDQLNEVPVDLDLSLIDPNTIGAWQ